MKTHWRKFAGKHLIGEELNGEDVTLTIKEVTSEEVYSISKKENVPMTVLHFQQTDRTFGITNNINHKAISKELGSPYIEDWIGKEITLTPNKEKRFGEVMDVIRIKKNPNNYLPKKN